MKPIAAIALVLLAGCSEWMQAVTPEAYAQAEKACQQNDGLGWVYANSYKWGEWYKVTAVCRNGLRATFKSERKAVP